MMKFAKKLLILCAMAAVMCVPAYAEDVSIDISLLMFGRATLTVNIDGELSNSLSNTYVPGDSVTVTAPDVDAKNFKYWTDSAEKILSYNPELTLTIYANTILNAVYGTDTATAQPAAGFLSITRAGGQVLFNVITSAPSGSTITEYGIRYSTTQSTLDGLKGDDDVTVESADNVSASNWLFSAIASDDTTYYAAAYVTAGGETYYSEVETVSVSDLESGVASIANVLNLLLGVSLDNVSDEV